MSVNKIRYVVKQIIAHLKTCRIIHTAYRPPTFTLNETISAPITLEI